MVAACSRSWPARAALEKAEHGSQRDVRRFNREMEAAFLQELPDNATVMAVTALGALHTEYQMHV